MLNLKSERNCLRAVLPFLKTALTLVVFIILGQLLYGILTNYYSLPQGLDVRNPKFVIASSVYCTFVVLYSVLAYKFVDRRRLKDFGISITRKDIFFSIIALAVITLAFLTLALATKQFGIAKWGLANISFTYMLYTIAIYFTVGLNEEIFFRGYLFKSFSHYGKIPGYVMSILVFTLIHFSNQNITIPYLLQLIIISFLLTYMFDVTGSIWPSVIFHTGIDLFIALAGGNPRQGTLISWYYLDSRINLNDLIMFVSIIIGITLFFILYFMYRRDKLRPDLYRERSF